MIKTLSFLDKGIEKVTTYLLAISVFSMLLISLLIIIFRWFSITCLWFEPLVRHLVFLSAFLGGVIATGRGTHIAIDIVSKSLESKGMVFLQKQIRRVINLTAFFTLCWLIKASYDFCLIEFKYGKLVFLNIHSGFLVAIIPAGFVLIAYRFLYRFINSFFES